MIFFWLKESIKLIGRAKSSFFLSLISMSISVFLITASLVSIMLSNEMQKNIKQNVSINVFLKDTLSSDQISRLQTKIKRNSFINTISYIDKNQAARDFIKETGEDFRRVLDYNPLPASFLITLKEGYVEKDSINKIVEVIGAYNGVDDVVFQQEFVYKILSFIKRIQTYIFAFTGILFFISIYIVFSTVKLVTKSKYEELESMKLVGAKLSTIKMPIVLNCVLIGLLAGLISLGIFYVIGHYSQGILEIHKLLNFDNPYFLIVALAVGPVIGSLVSLFSLRKISLKI